jgi:hypothetical protein
MKKDPKQKRPKNTPQAHFPASERQMLSQQKKMDSKRVTGRRRGH